jgi:hypothetical protein
MPASNPHRWRAIYSEKASMSAKVKPDNTERNRRIVEMYKAGLSLRAIGRELAVTVNIVAGVLHREGPGDRGGKRIPYIDVVGQRFTRLLVVNRHQNDQYGRVRYSCLCDCGNMKIIESSHLRMGRTKSCGCLGLEHPTASYIHRKRALKAAA